MKMWRQPLFVLFICVVIVATRELNDEAKPPFSPSQCKILCQNKCKSYVFVKSGYTCHVTEPSKETEGEADLFGNGQPVQYTKIIRSGSKNILCGKSTTETIKQRQDLRLLIVGRNIRQTIFSDVHKNNTAVTPYPYLNFIYVNAIVYISNRRRILLATRGGKIISAPLDRHGGQVILKRHILSSAIAVDEHSQYVFLGLDMYGGREGSLHRMTTDGHYLRLVVQLPHSVQSISPDPKHNKVFICTIEIIFYTYYDDTSLRVLTDSKWSHSMSFDPEENVIYYHDRTRIIRKSLSTGTKYIVKKFLRKQVSYIVYHRNKLFVSYQKKIIICETDKYDCRKLKIDEFEFERKIILIQ